jgi:carboxypeptidase Q
MKLLVMKFVLLVILVINVSAQVEVDLNVIQKIKKKAIENSKVMETSIYICDIYGPRLSGSPGYLKAAQWTVEQLKNWGIEKSYLEPWGTFGRGWQVENAKAEMIKPVYMPMIVYPKSWTGSTNGVITGKPMLIEYEIFEDVEKLKGTLEGKIVLLGKPRKAEIHFEPDARRLDENEILERAQSPFPGEKSPWAAKRGEWKKKRELRKKIGKFFEDEKVGVILELSDREHGTIRVHRGGSYNVGDSYGAPSLVVSVEQYNRLWRMLKKDTDVELRVNVQNTFFESDSLGRNVIAEIPGTDSRLEDEIVMLGAHLDSWHSGTGATDNGANCAVMMEAVRIIKQLNLKPKRTIRLCLWDGEEQGYKGSKGYIKKHIGNLETLELMEEHENISAYFNLDNGAGKIRGIYLQENDAARPVFETMLKPFSDMGVGTVTIRKTTGTDHMPFNEIGLPGFQFMQDPINYMNRTHHTNMDVVDNLIEGDLIHNALVVASVVYHAAMMDEKMPRKVMPTVEENKKNSW